MSVNALCTLSGWIDNLHAQPPAMSFRVAIATISAMQEILTRGIVLFIGIEQLVPVLTVIYSPRVGL
jgi:hypothetical protein